MEDLQIVEIKNHWFVGSKSQLENKNERRIIGEGKTREQALEDAVKYLNEYYKKLDQVFIDISICLNREDYDEVVCLGKSVEIEGFSITLGNGEIRTKFSDLYFDQEENRWVDSW